MPHPATSSGWPPKEVTASTTTSAPCARAIDASAGMGFRTPVDVSACTIATTCAGDARPPLERFGIAGPSPLHLEAIDNRAVPAAHFGEPIAEVAGHDDQDARAGLDEIGDHGLHSGRSGTRDRKRKRP